MLSCLRWRVAVTTHRSATVLSDLLVRASSDKPAVVVQASDPSDVEVSHAVIDFNQLLAVGSEGSSSETPAPQTIDVSWLQTLVHTVKHDLTGDRNTIARRKVDVVRHLQNILDALASYDEAAKHGLKVPQLVAGPKTHGLVSKLVYSLDAHSCLKFLPVVSKIVEITGGQIPAWQESAENLLQLGSHFKDFEKLTTDQAETYVSAVLSSSLRPREKPHVSLRQWEMASACVAACTETLPTDMLFTFGLYLHSAAFSRSLKLPALPQVAVDKKLTALKENGSSTVLSELCLRALDFTTKEVNALVKLWAKSDFASAQPVDVVKSQLDLWPTERQEDISLLVDMLTTLVKGGATNKHTIDVEQTLLAHEGALSEVSPSVANHCKAILPFLPPKAKTALVFSLLEKAGTMSSPSELVDILEMMSACDIIDKVHYRKVMSSFRSILSDESVLLEPAQLQTIGRILATRVGQPDPFRLRDLPRDDIGFWNLYHKHLLQSSDVDLQLAVDIFQSLKSTSSAFKVVNTCGRKVTRQKDLDAERQFYRSLVAVLEEIFTGYQQYWSPRQAAAIDRRKSPTVTKLIGDMQYLGRPLPECIFRLLHLHYLITKCSLPVVPEVVRLTTAMIPRLSVREAVELFFSVADVQQNSRMTSLRSLLTAIIAKIEASLTVAHVSTLHRHTYLDRLYHVSQAAYETMATGKAQQGSVTDVDNPALLLCGRAWPGLLTAMQRPLVTLDDYVNVLTTAAESGASTHACRAVLLRLLLIYSHLETPTDSEQQLVFRALVALSNMEQATLIPAGDHDWKPYGHAVGKALLSLAQQADKHTHQLERPACLSLLYRINDRLGIHASLPYDSMVLSGDSTTTDATISHHRDAEPLLKNMFSTFLVFRETIHNASIVSLQDVVHYAKRAEDVVHRETLLHLCRQELASSFVRIVQKRHGEQPHQSSVGRSLVAGLAGTFYMCPEVERECREMLNGLTLQDVMVLFGLIRGGNLNEDIHTHCHNFLSAGVCYHQGQLSLADPMTIMDTLNGLRVNDVIQSAVVKIVVPTMCALVRVEDSMLRSNLGVLHSLLGYMLIARASSPRLIWPLSTAFAQLDESSDVYSDVTMLAECHFLLALNGQHYHPNRTTVYHSSNIGIITTVLISMLFAVEKGADLRQIIQYVRHPLDDTLPPFYRQCFQLARLTTTPGDGVVRRAPTSTVSSPHTNATLSSALDVALSGRQVADLIVADLVQIPFCAAFSEIGEVLSMAAPLGSGGEQRMWPVNTAHRVAWLLVPTTTVSGGRLAVGEHVLVRFQRLLLSSRGWKVIIVPEYDIAAGNITADALLRHLSRTIGREVKTPH